MSVILNIVWILCGGIETAAAWALFGALCYVSIIGIPLGRQAFKMARLTLAPFGTEIAYGGGTPSVVANVFWVVLAGIWLAAAYVVLGLLYCVTIIGIPVGKQCFKMAKLSLMPFGATVTER